MGILADTAKKVRAARYPEEFEVTPAEAEKIADEWVDTQPRSLRKAESLRREWRERVKAGELRVGGARIVVKG